jgi:hypothetical protein
VLCLKVAADILLVKILLKQGLVFLDSMLFVFDVVLIYFLMVKASVLDMKIVGSIVDFFCSLSQSVVKLYPLNLLVQLSCLVFLQYLLIALLLDLFHPELC